MLQNTKTISNINVSTGFFGKLPGFLDFIKYNAAGKEILTIDNWLQEGLALAKLKYKNEWKNYYDNSLNLNFVYPFTGTDNTTIGVISASTDKNGRSFPFVMFSNIKKNVNDGSSFYLIPSAHREIFHFLADIVEANKSAEDTSGLKSLTDNVKLSNINHALVLSDYKKFISETKLYNILDLENENQFNLKDFFDERLKIFEHFIGFKYSVESNPTNISYLVSYCIQLFQKVFKKSDSPAVIFWTRNDDKLGLLFLSFAKPMPGDFIDLLFYDKASLITIEENSHNNKEDFHIENSIIRDDSYISGNITLNELLNSINNYLN